MRQLVWSKVQLRLTGLFRPLQADSFEDGAGMLHFRLSDATCELC